MSDETKDMMDNPEMRKQIEQLAQEKGISVEQAAKEHLAKQSENN